MQLCGYEVGNRRPFFLIAGPCVIESEAMALDIAHQMKEITAELGIPYIFKASYDKANRTSGKSFRGLGMEKGLEILAKVRAEVGVPVLTDVHTEAEVPAVAAVVDVLQTPAFLCRQTDFIRACAQSGKPVNIKKGQFLAPGDMANVIAKARAAAQEAGLDPDRFMCCERGASFGYGNLVSDMRGLAIMRATARRLSWMRRIPCSSPAATARVPAVSVSSFRCSRARPAQWALRGSLWKRIRILQRHSLTVPMPFRSIA